MGLAHQLHRYGQPRLETIFNEKQPGAEVQARRYAAASIKSHAGIGSESRSAMGVRRGVRRRAPDCASRKAIPRGSAPDGVTPANSNRVISMMVSSTSPSST